MDRRHILKLIGAAWITPVVQSVSLPAHAQTSAPPEEPPCDDCTRTEEYPRVKFILQETQDKISKTYKPQIKNRSGVWVDV